MDGSTWTPGNDLTGSSNTPGGSSGHVQFNNAGSFGGDATFLDNTNKRLGDRQKYACCSFRNQSKFKRNLSAPADDRKRKTSMPVDVQKHS